MAPHNCGATILKILQQILDSKIKLSIPKLGKQILNVCVFQGPVIQLRTQRQTQKLILNLWTTFEPISDLSPYDGFLTTLLRRKGFVRICSMGLSLCFIPITLRIVQNLSSIGVDQNVARVSRG